MEKIKIRIPEEASKEVEFLFHKYNSLMSIISYLQENGKITEEQFDKKLDELTYLCIDLEKKKHQYGSQYKPENIGDTYNYTFDFDNHQIVYEVVK